MKKLVIILLVSLLGNTIVKAQGEYLEDKTEYRYPNFVIGFNHSFGGSIGGVSNDLLIHSNRGDYTLEKKGFTYTPGFQVGLVYNLDFKNNKTGVVVGAEVVDYGFRNKYKAVNSDYDVKETFRAIGLQVPILFKFGASDIYRDMSYAYLGVKPIVNFMMGKTDKGSWTDDRYGMKLDGKKALSVAATFGFNYDIVNFSVNYMFMEFVDSKFVDENGLQPYKNIKGHIYLCTSLNIPMTRWTTIHNWTAEKIRRKLHNGKSL